MPQLNPEFFVSQLFWLIVTFSFLLVFLWRISLPRIGNVLEKRERKISEDLTAAKELQVEAEKIQDTIDSQLKQARTDASDMIKSSSLKILTYLFVKETSSESISLVPLYVDL